MAEAIMNKANISRVVEEIRSYVNSADETSSPQIAELASTYASLCRKANERLERCSEMLRKGHRPEAISLAEAEPDLLWVVSELSFAELAIWQDRIAMYGLERSPQIKGDVANLITEAYTLESNAAGLLVEHRKLAICEAPLRDRLTVLRKIAAADPTTPFWGEDLRQYEFAFQSELAREGDELLTKGAPEMWERFLDKSLTEPWSSPPHEALQDCQKRLTERLAFSTKLPEIANRIRGAVQSQNWQMITQLKDAWTKVESQLGTVGSTRPIPLELLQAVQQPFEQLEVHREALRRAAFDRDVQQLYNAIQLEASFERVEHLLQVAESYGFPIPRVVLDALASYKRQDVQGKAISVVLVIVALGTFVVIGAILYLLIVMAKR